MTALRSLWNGALRLGELEVPVALAATRGPGDVALRTLHRPCAHPLVQQLECPIHGQVPAEELVSGWEVAPGEFVLVEPDELEQLAAAGRPAGRTIEVLQVFPADELDPTLVQASYWLMPAGGEFARRGYRLIAAALGVKTALLVRLVYRSEKIAAVRTIAGGVLLLQMLSAAADRHPFEPIIEDLAGTDSTPAERRLMRELLARKLRPLDEALLVNRRRQALRSLLEAKLAGGKRVVSEPAPQVPGRPAVAAADLEDALRRSLNLLAPDGGRNSANARPARRKAATAP